MTETAKHNQISNPTDDKKPGGDTTSLFVSLYLIILAFFMVLNSISNQSQTKVKSATDSVTRAFDNPFAPEADFVDVTESEGTETPNDEFYEQLQGVFASLVGFEGKFPTQGGNKIQIEFDQSNLYHNNSPEFRQDQERFFNQLANFLRSESIGTIRELEYIIYSGDRFPTGPEYWTDVSVLRAGSIVHRMMAGGVRENQMSIGVSPGPEDKLSISFFIRDEISSRQNLEDADRTGLGEQSVPMPGRAQ